MRRIIHAFCRAIAACALLSSTPVLAQNSPSPSTITGPTIVVHRCSVYSQDYWNFTNIGPFIGLPPFGLQYCTNIIYPSQPTLVSQGAVNVTIPVVFLGDMEMTVGTPPPTYPFGQDFARVSVQVIATDFEGAPILSSVQPNPPPGNVLCGSPVQTIGPLPQGTPTPPSLSATGVLTLFDVNSPQAGPGDAASGAQDTGNGASGQIVIPLNLDWAISLLKFNVTVLQALPGSDPENTGLEFSQGCGSDACRGPMQTWTNLASFNTGNLASQWFAAAQQEMQQELQLGSSQAVPAPNCNGASNFNCTCPLAEGVSASVLPAGAFQLNYFPLAIIYSGLGDKANPFLALTQLSGTTGQLMNQTNIVNTNTVDDKTTLTGQLTISGNTSDSSNNGGNNGGVSLSTQVTDSPSWDTSIENDLGNQYGSQLTITSTTQLGQTEYNPFPPGWPSLSAATTNYYAQPFWNDLFVIAPNAQFLAWAYPGAGNDMVQPLSSEPSVNMTVLQLDACAKSSTPTIVYGSNIPGTNTIPWTFQSADCVALLQLDPFYVAGTQNVDVNTAEVSAYRDIYVGQAPSYAGWSWNQQSNSTTTPQTTNQSQYTTTYTSIIANNLTDNPIPILNNILSIGSSTSTQVSQKAQFTYQYMSQAQLENQVTAQTNVLDDADDGNEVNVHVWQDGRFGTLAIQDLDIHVLKLSLRPCTVNPNSAACHLSSLSNPGSKPTHPTVQVVKSLIPPVLGSKFRHINRVVPPAGPSSVRYIPLELAIPSLSKANLPAPELQRLARVATPAPTIKRSTPTVPAGTAAPALSPSPRP